MAGKIEREKERQRRRKEEKKDEFGPMKE